MISGSLKRKSIVCLLHNFFCAAILLFISLCAHSQIELKAENESVLIGKYLEIYLDPTGEKNVHEIAKSQDLFTACNSDVINAQVTESTLWIKLRAKNLTNINQIFLEIRTPNIDEVTLYKESFEHFRSEGPYGQAFPYSKRFYDHPHFIFDLDLRSQEESTYYISVKNADQITLPLQIGTSKSIVEGIFNFDVSNGIYLGIFLVMFLYNLFLYFSTRNKSYIYYSVFVFTIGLALFTIAGYSFKYVWPNLPWLEQRALVMVSAAIAITALLFATSFLKLKHHLPKARIVLISFVICYLVVFILALTGFIAVGQKGIFALSGSIFVIFGIALYLSRKGIREAKFYLAAWSVYLIGIVVFLLKDFGVLPYNAITTRLMHFGSALEVILLSFALGDYVNTLRIEKEKSQKKVLEELKRNEQIIKEQNVILEKKVSERTFKLEKANLDLSQAMNELKDTQSQLVDAEKMASLGQLTAGIAHEINNPINFVSSNISPLKQDIEDLKKILSTYEEKSTPSGISLESLAEIKELKEELDIDYAIEEIDTLLVGIKDGANRTSEIVKGLKNFSRLDESSLKEAQINDGIESTTLLLKAKFENVKLTTHLSKIEEIDCLPGKLNQLFMNIIDNALYACHKKEYQEGEVPELIISTTQTEIETKISFKDNGVGMEEYVQQKIFEPFFTTKDVGEGTGLGMSIAHGIIISHQGVIKINSKPNLGTEIVITLPRVKSQSKSTI